MFKDPFSFNGRIRGSEFGLSIVIYLFGFYLMGTQVSHHGNSGDIYLLLLIPILWFHWAQGAKRCHDLSNSGWWQIIPLYWLWLLFEDGKPWPNEYGESPKYENPRDKDEYSQPYGDRNGPYDK